MEIKEHGCAECWARGKRARRVSGGHLADKAHRQPRDELGILERQNQTGARVLTRMHDLDHRANLLRGSTGLAGVDLEHVSRDDPVGAAAVEEYHLLRIRD